MRETKGTLAGGLRIGGGGLELRYGRGRVQELGGARLRALPKISGLLGELAKGLKPFFKWRREKCLLG